mgnify:CR=1 FL=1
MLLEVNQSLELIPELKVDRRLLVEHTEELVHIALVNHTKELVRIALVSHMMVVDPKVHKIEEVLLMVQWYCYQVVFPYNLILNLLMENIYNNFFINVIIYKSLLS